MLVGAGRGPLVDRSIQAAKRANRTVKIYALEKNPSAVVVLKSKNKDSWQNMVTIVQADMRYWDPPEKADILLSELLGSFGGM